MNKTSETNEILESQQESECWGSAFEIIDEGFKNFLQQELMKVRYTGNARTLRDMTWEEIKAIEKEYNCKINRHFYSLKESLIIIFSNDKKYNSK